MRLFRRRRTYILNPGSSNIQWADQDGNNFTEASIVTVRTGTEEIIQIGNEALKMVGRTPANLETVYPIRNGIMVDSSLAMKMIKRFFESNFGSKALKGRPNVLVIVPYGISNDQKNTIKSSMEDIGFNVLPFIASSHAAAIGCNFFEDDNISGKMIVDMGGGKCDIALVSSLGVIDENTCNIGGKSFDTAIIDHLRIAHELIIGPVTAEALKIELTRDGTNGNHPPGENGSEKKEIPEVHTSTIKTNGNRVYVVSGNDLKSRRPDSREIKHSELKAVLAGPVRSITDMIRNVLSEAPPEISSDLADNGVVLIGKSSPVHYFQPILPKDTGVDVKVSENPEFLAIEGARMSFQTKTPGSS